MADNNVTKNGNPHFCLVANRGRGHKAEQGCGLIHARPLRAGPGGLDPGGLQRLGVSRNVKATSTTKPGGRAGDFIHRSY